MEKISIVGLDGSGKSSALERIIDKHLSSAAVVDTDRLLYQPGVWKVSHVPIGRRLVALFDLATLVGDRVNSKLLAGAMYGIVMGMCTYPSNLFLNIKYHPELVIQERDVAVDGSVYSHYYIPGASKLSASQRLGLITRVLRHPLPNKVIYLDVEPEVALQRIHMSLEEKAWTGRKKRPHLHETLEGLRGLRQAYHEVLEAAEAAGTRVVKINTTPLRPEEEASALYAQILPHIVPDHNGSGAGYTNKTDSVISETNGRNGHRPTKVLIVK